MEESRNCPYCGKEMRKGKLSAGGRRIFWTRRAMKLTSMARMGDIPMAPDYWHGNVENAYLCAGCKKVIVDVQTPIKLVTVEPNGDIRDYQDDDE